MSRVSASALSLILIAAQLLSACSVRVDPTLRLQDAGQGGAPPTAESRCDEHTHAGRTFLICSSPTLGFTPASRDCQLRGATLARITSAEENDALVLAIQELPTHSNLWLGGTRDDEHVWRWPDGTTFWTGLKDGSATSGIYVRWQDGEPNNMSTVTDEPERCAALALSDGGWRDRACSIELSYICERPPADP